jgi:hypothetical protein
MNQSLSTPQLDLFGGFTSTVASVRRPTISRTEEQRKALSESRFARQFSMSSLYAELDVEEVLDKDDEDYEGAADPELDAQLRITNADISHCTDQQLHTFVFEVHRAVLERHLAFLTSEDQKPKVLREKAFILQWAFCDDIVRGRPQSQIPCSFHNCCMASGCNPDEVRSRLLQKELVRDLLVRLHLVERHKLPRLRKQVMYGDIVGYDHPMIGNESVAISGV